jgi:hypothetical protein
MLLPVPFPNKAALVLLVKVTLKPGTAVLETDKNTSEFKAAEFEIV